MITCAGILSDVFQKNWLFLILKPVESLVFNSNNCAKIEKKYFFNSKVHFKKYFHELFSLEQIILVFKKMVLWNTQKNTKAKNTAVTEIYKRNHSIKIEKGVILSINVFLKTFTLYI